MTSRAAHHPVALRPETAIRVGKCVRLLGSDRPGEVAGAAQALRRILGIEGLDFHDLAVAIETVAATPFSRVRRPPTSWRRRTMLITGSTSR